MRTRPQTRLSVHLEDSGPEACHRDGPCYMCVSGAFKSEKTGPGTEPGGGAPNAGELTYHVSRAPVRRVHTQGTQPLTPTSASPVVRHPIWGSKTHLIQNVCLVVGVEGRRPGRIHLPTPTHSQCSGQESSRTRCPIQVRIHAKARVQRGVCRARGGSLWGPNHQHRGPGG